MDAAFGAPCQRTDQGKAARVGEPWKGRSGPGRYANAFPKMCLTAPGAGAANPRNVAVTAGWRVWGTWFAVGDAAGAPEQTIVPLRPVLRGARRRDQAW